MRVKIIRSKSIIRKQEMTKILFLILPANVTESEFMKYESICMYIGTTSL